MPPEDLFMSIGASLVAVILPKKLIEFTATYCRSVKKSINWPPQRLPAIHLDLRGLDLKSEYVVRTQPADLCLSTVEIVAHAVAILQDDVSAVDKLVAPLRALCSIQVWVSTMPDLIVLQVKQAVVLCPQEKEALRYKKS